MTQDESTTRSRPPKRYRVLVPEGRGFMVYSSGGKLRRAERGDVVSDIPSKSIPWLLRDGQIEEVSDD